MVRKGRAAPIAAVTVLALLVGGCAAQTASSVGASPVATEGGADLTTDDGLIRISQVQQMSVVIETRDAVIYTDPTRGAARYAVHPSPDVILVSHEHHEHFDVETLEELVVGGTRLVVPPYVAERLPDSLRNAASFLANGERTEIGTIVVDAVGSYGLDGEAEQWHPPGRGNGYVLDLDGGRVYVAGSTAEVPEVLALDDIRVAVLPLYPPYALGPQGAHAVVAALEPEIAYIYQYNSASTRDEFVRLTTESGVSTTVVAPDIDG